MTIVKEYMELSEELSERDFSPRSRVLMKLPLTACEDAVMKLMCQGLSNKQIARELGTTYETVRSHLYHAYQRFGVHSDRAAMVKYWRMKACEMGLLLFGRASNKE